MAKMNSACVCALGGDNYQEQENVSKDGFFFLFTREGTYNYMCEHSQMQGRADSFLLNQDPKRTK